MKLIYSFAISIALVACGSEKKTDTKATDTLTGKQPAGHVTISGGQPGEAPTVEGMNTPVPKQPAGDFQKANVTVNTVENTEGEANGTWGYQILLEGKVYITQPGIPSVPGNNGFKTEAKARKA